MAKKKLQHFAEMNEFKNVFQPPAHQMYQHNFFLKGKWKTDYFKNDNPIVLEVGCGKGEYTIGLAKKFPEKNFIGIDIKGARIWKGSKTAIVEQIDNVAFIRNKVEFITSFFSEGEVSEIWITFPDPQARRPKKRLTSPRFLSSYAKISEPNGIIHLKTDSLLMYEYTQRIVKINLLKLIYSTNDLYANPENPDFLQIKTFYEKKFLEQGINITYLKFSLNGVKEFSDTSNITPHG